MRNRPSKTQSLLPNGAPTRTQAASAVALLELARLLGRLAAREQVASDTAPAAALPENNLKRESEQHDQAE